MRFSNLHTSYRKFRAQVLQATRWARSATVGLTAKQSSAKFLGPQDVRRHDGPATSRAPRWWALVAFAPGWPVGPYRYGSGRPRWYVAAFGALSAALVLQHVASLDSEDGSSAAANQVITEAGAGGNTLPRYLEPPQLSILPSESGAPVLNGLPVKRELKAPRAVRGIPVTVLSAYLRAEGTLNASQPGCRLPMPLLAAIGRVESGHAQGGNVDAVGTTRTPILGPRLNGGPGIAAIRDTDGGAYDGDTTWDRAVGPMQFIPSTWRGWASDGNSDGRSDPNNVFDAALAAGRYLCAAGRDLATAEGLRRGVLAYNHSEHYLNVVLSWMRVYAGGAVEVPNASRGQTDQRRVAHEESTSKADSTQRRDSGAEPRPAANPHPTTQRPAPSTHDLSTPPKSSEPPASRDEDNDDKMPAPDGLKLPPIPTQDPLTEREFSPLR